MKRRELLAAGAFVLVPSAAFGQARPDNAGTTAKVAEVGVAARTLGVKIPESVLARATRVIE